MPTLTETTPVERSTTARVYFEKDCKEPMTLDIILGLRKNRC